MEFLKKHFEKLILGVALIVLLVSCFLVLTSLHKARQDVKEVQTRIEEMPEEKPIEPLSEDQIDLSILTDPAIRLDLGDDEIEGASLVEPPKYILCAGPQCSQLIPFSAETCRFCGADQPEEDPFDKFRAEDDFDEDGMSNAFERKYSDFLNPQDPNDAGVDHDGDGFSNVEEFRWKSEPDNYENFPALARNLRFLGMRRRRIPIIFRALARNNSDDPADWDITCAILDGGSLKRSILTVGEAVAGYKITGAKYKVDDEGKDISELQVTAQKDGTKYSLTLVPRKETAFQTEKDLVVYFIFLSNRYDPRRCRRMPPAKLGETFELKHGSGATETYEVTVLTENSVTVQAVGSDPEPAVFEIQQLNTRKDFLSATGARGGMGGGGPERPGGRGAAPQAQQRVVRRQPVRRMEVPDVRP